MTFDLTIFSSKETLEAHIESLIEKRNKLGKKDNKTEKEYARKDELTIAIIHLSEISEIDY